MGNRGAGRSTYRVGISFEGASFVLSGLLGLASSVAIARAYGVRAIGDFALATAPVNMAWFLSTVKERPGFIRELAFLEPRAPRVTALFWAVFAFSFTLTLVVVALAVVVCYFVFNGPIYHPALFWPSAFSLIVYLLITNTCFNFDTLLTGFRAGRQLFSLRQHQALMFVGVGIALGVAHWGMWGLIWATTISWTTVLVHRLVIARHYLRLRIGRQELRDGFRTLPDILRFGLKVAPGGVADGISNTCGTWILGALRSVSVVGAFNRAYNLGRRFMELNTRLSEMLFPTLIERRARGDREGYDRALIDTIRYTAVFMLWPAAAGGGAAVGVMRVFGPGFSRVSDALIVILLMPAASSISMLQRHALMSLEKPGLTSVSATLRMVVTLGCTIGLTIALGATGTAVAIILGFVADSTYMQFITRKHLATPLLKLWRPRQMIALVAAYAGGFASAHVVFDAIGGYGGLLVALAAGSLAYALAFLVLGGMNERDRGRLGELTIRLKARRSGAARAAAIAGAAVGPDGPAGGPDEPVDVPTVAAAVQSDPGELSHPPKAAGVQADAGDPSGPPVAATMQAEAGEAFHPPVMVQPHRTAPGSGPAPAVSGAGAGGGSAAPAAAIAMGFLLVGGAGGLAALRRRSPRR